MELKQLRDELDRIDDAIMALFAQRMATVKKVAEAKLQSDAAIADPEREREILRRTSAQVQPELTRYARILMHTLFDASRAYQRTLMRRGEAALALRIRAAVEQTPKLFPTSARVACQGTMGAYSQLACDRLFEAADIVFVKSFEGVFSAVEKGLCDYGILPIENSSYGAVNDVYDRLRRHHVHIVRGTRLQISHALLARPGTALSDIREIASHEQAFGQCSAFMAAHPEIKVTICENTAVAARMVAEGGRPNLASISSPECARLYGLQVLDEGIQNERGNYTRFICIKRDMEIYPGANKISLLLAAEHRPGALRSVIEQFSMLGINISKLESRPIPGRDFEFMFYFDLDASVYSPALVDLLGDMAENTEGFKFFGAYSEV
ncbi:MAG: bifunctional chorismate mutase/prephenate dehydratase [Ruminococcaceae bacterium]|nr:bifunctional chorismate mutase/prephenate dehydratase [Oscillospiraceae bacterium]